MRTKNNVATHRRRKRVLKAAKGYYGAKHEIFKTAKQAVVRSQEYAYISRRLRKRDFRKLWITRINAAVRPSGLSYSQFMHGLKLSKIELNRKMISELAIHNQDEFNKLVSHAQKALADQKTTSGASQ